MTALEDTVEWTAKGAFATPNTDLTTEVAWTAKGNPMWAAWNGEYGGWTYHRAITINNTSGGILSNSRRLVELTPANFTYAHSEGDGADIRFVRADETTPLDYWIEEWVEDGTSKVWVKVDSIPTGNNVCGYLVYGKAGASDESDGEATFTFFDHFNGAEIDTDKWEGDTGSCTITDSVLSFTGTSKTLYGKTYSSRPSITEMKVKVGSWVAGKYAYIGIRNASSERLFLKTYSDSYKRLYSYTAAGNEYTAITNDVTAWLNLKIKWKAGETKYYVDDVLKATHTTRVPASPLSAYFYVWASSGSQTIDCDYIFMRDYVLPEPTLVIGSEQIATVANRSVITDIASVVGWTAKGAHAITSAASLSDVVEWTAAGEFAPPHSFIFIDLR